METFRKKTSIENDSTTILSLQNLESKIPQWQVDEIKKRTENYLKNPTNVIDIDDFLKEIEDEL